MRAHRLFRDLWKICGVLSQVQEQATATPNPIDSTSPHAWHRVWLAVPGISVVRRCGSHNHHVHVSGNADHMGFSGVTSLLVYRCRTSIEPWALTSTKGCDPKPFALGYLLVVHHKQKPTNDQVLHCVEHSQGSKDIRLFSCQIKYLLSQLVCHCGRMRFKEVTNLYGVDTVISTWTVKSRNLTQSPVTIRESECGQMRISRYLAKLLPAD